MSAFYLQILDLWPLFWKTITCSLWISVGGFSFTFSFKMRCLCKVASLWCLSRCVELTNWKHTNVWSNKTRRQHEWSVIFSLPLILLEQTHAQKTRFSFATLLHTPEECAWYCCTCFCSVRSFPFFRISKCLLYLRGPFFYNHFLYPLGRLVWKYLWVVV